jgi:hypothetical protein
MRALVPEDLHRNGRARAALASLARGCAIAAGMRRDPDLGRALRALWRDDKAAQLVSRAAVGPHSLGDTALAPTFVKAIIESLGPVSAGAQVLQSGLQLSFNGAASITVPSFISSASNASFVAEGTPIPVRALSVSSPAEVLRPRKLALLTTLTSEMMESSNAEALVTDCLTRSIGLALDSVLFDSTASSSVRPAGLRSGIAALTASTAAANFDAMVEDIGALVAAVSSVAGTGPFILITSPARVVALTMRLFQPPQNVTLLASSAIAAGDVIVIAPAALVSATGADVSVEASREAAVHMDTTPAALVGKTAPPPALADVATPQRSVFQTDSIALKLRLPVAWLLRDSRGLAWLSNVTKW